MILLEWKIRELVQCFYGSVLRNKEVVFLLFNPYVWIFWCSQIFLIMCWIVLVIFRIMLVIPLKIIYLKKHPLLRYGTTLPQFVCWCRRNGRKRKSRWSFVHQPLKYFLISMNLSQQTRARCVFYRNRLFNSIFLYFWDLFTKGCRTYGKSEKVRNQMFGRDLWVSEISEIGNLFLFWLTVNTFGIQRQKTHKSLNILSEKLILFSSDATNQYWASEAETVTQIWDYSGLEMFSLHAIEIPCINQRWNVSDW